MKLVEQPDVLNGDHGLIGEGGGKIDVPLVERLHSSAGDQKQTDHDAIADKGHAQHAAYAGAALERAKSVFRIALGIINDYRRIRKKNTRAEGPATRLVLYIQNRTAFFFLKTEARYAPEIVAETTVDDCYVCIAQTSR
jgi:hypothetical protein